MTAREMFRCQEIALAAVKTVRIQTYVNAVELAQAEPRIEVETSGRFVIPDTLSSTLTVSLRGVSRLASEMIQVEGHRYSRMESYNKISGKRVVTGGWLEEEAPPGDRTRFMDVARLPYALKLAAERGGMEAPDAQRCDADLIALDEPEVVAGKPFYIIRIWSAENTIDGQPCDDATRVSTRYWIDRDTLRPYRIVLESEPAPNALNSGAPDDRVRWRGETIFSEYNVGFEIRAPIEE